jgi:hypothetical protein
MGWPEIRVVQVEVLCQIALSIKSQQPEEAHGRSSSWHASPHDASSTGSSEKKGLKGNLIRNLIISSTYQYARRSGPQPGTSTSSSSTTTACQCQWAANLKAADSLMARPSPSPRRGRGTARRRGSSSRLPAALAAACQQQQHALPQLPHHGGVDLLVRDAKHGAASLSTASVPAPWQTKHTWQLPTSGRG